MKIVKTVASMACYMGIGLGQVALAGGPDRLNLGIGVKSENSIYKTIKDETQVIPAINAQKNGFYFQGSELGFRVVENQNIEVGPVISFFEGYGFDEEDFGEGFRGLRTRDSGISYGVLAAFEAEPFTFEIKPMKHSQAGASIELSAELEYRVESFLLMTSLFVEHLQKDYVDNYFGVSQAEVNNGLNTALSRSYKADSVNNIGIEVGAFYELSPRFILGGRLEHVVLDNAITDSPLVDGKSITSVSASISYRF